VKAGPIYIKRYCKALIPREIKVTSSYSATPTAIMIYPGDVIEADSKAGKVDFAIKFYKDGQTRRFYKRTPISKVEGQADVLGTPQGSSPPILFPWDDSEARLNGLFLIIPTEKGKIKAVDFRYESRGRMKIVLSDCVQYRSQPDYDYTTRYDILASVNDIERSIKAQFENAAVQEDERQWFVSQLKSEGGVKLRLHILFESGEQAEIGVTVKDSAADDTAKTALIQKALKPESRGNLEEACELLRDKNQACDFINLLMTMARFHREGSNYFIDSWKLLTHLRKKTP
jgi:hypothetical protein